MKTSATSIVSSRVGTFRLARIALIVLAVAAVFSALPDMANTLSWSGGGAPDGNWTNPDNWGSVGSIPTNGDTLVFTYPQPNQVMTNNIPGLTLERIRFLGAGGGYNISGNALTITNGLLATNSAGANSFYNGLTFGSPLPTVAVASNAVLIFNGVVSGTAGLTKTGLGALVFGAVSNSYTGPSVFNGGLVYLATVTNAIPDGGSLYVTNCTVQELLSAQIGAIPVTIDGGGLLNLNGQSDAIGSVLNLRNGGNVQTSGGTLTLGANATISATNVPSTIGGNLNIGSGTCVIQGDASLVINANLSGSADIISQSSTNRDLSLFGQNTFTGGLTVANGFVSINNFMSLGATNSGVVVSNGATLYFIANGISYGITNKTLTLNGVGRPFYGALDAESGGNTNTWTGPIILNDISTIAPYGSGAVLRLSGQISGVGGISMFTVGGTNSTIILEGSGTNTFSNTTTVNSGTLVLGKAGVPAMGGNLIISGPSCVVRMAGDSQTATNADVLVNAGALFDFSSYETYIDTLRGAGTVNFGVGGWIWIGLKNGSSTFDGQFTGSGYAPGWTVGKTGSGTFVMNGDNTYTNGTVTVGGTGKMIINGSHPRAPVLMSEGATLGGKGVVGNVGTYGVNPGKLWTIAPGQQGPGILTTSNVLFGTNCVFAVEVAGPTAGIDYDQLNVRGTCSVTGALLGINLTFTNSAVSVGQQFVVINNDGADPIVGHFNGYSNGDTWTQNGYTVVVNYNGGDGNDMVLTLTNLPGASVGSVVASGNGDGLIAPNECNYINVVVTNKTGTPMTGVTATLTSQTPGVIAMVSSAPYPNIAGNGKGTNTAPFQISTTPNFVCGSNINLTLTVSSASHGSFIVPVTLPSGAPALSAVRFDNNTTIGLLDVSTNESTNVVSTWTGGPITKVAVSLWISAPVDSDLNLTLIAPNGASVDLSSGNGGGANFGTGSADGNRTTFDDAAGTSITTGSPPFVGTFKPEAPLAALVGTTPVVGNWRLRVADLFNFGSGDTLRGWSLFLNGTDCGTGSGLCELCPNVTISSAFLGPAGGLTNYYSLVDGTNSTCGVTKPCPPTVFGPYSAENFLFRNGPSDACITIAVTNINVMGNMAIGAYSAAFDPNSPDRCPAYLGNPSSFIIPGSIGAFSISVASNAVFTVSVLGGSAGSYALTVTGGDCRPALNVTDIGSGKAKLDWTTAAVGYQLESTNVLPGSSVWPAITNTPSVVNSRFQVTNTVPAPNQFYHLRKAVP